MLSGGTQRRVFFFFLFHNYWDKICEVDEENRVPNATICAYHFRLVHCHQTYKPFGERSYFYVTFNGIKDDLTCARA